RRARRTRQRHTSHARGGADDEPGLVLPAPHGLDVGRLVELRGHRYFPAAFVCAARPASVFLPFFIVGFSSSTPQMTSAPSLHAWSFNVRMQSESLTESSQLAITGPMLSVGIGGTSSNTFTSQPGFSGGYCVSFGGGAAQADAESTTTANAQ